MHEWRNEIWMIWINSNELSLSVIKWGLNKDKECGLNEQSVNSVWMKDWELLVWVEDWKMRFWF